MVCLNLGLKKQQKNGKRIQVRGNLSSQTPAIRKSSISYLADAEDVKSLGQGYFGLGKQELKLEYKNDIIENFTFRNCVVSYGEFLEMNGFYGSRIKLYIVYKQGDDTSTDKDAHIDSDSDTESSLDDDDDHVSEQVRNNKEEGFWGFTCFDWEWKCIQMIYSITSITPCFLSGLSNSMDLSQNKD